MLLKLDKPQLVLMDIKKQRNHYLKNKKIINFIDK